MSQGLCRVCGSGLSQPLVECPTCSTPHHADCWEYNRGCSIYGCRPQLPAVRASAAVPVPARPQAWRPSLGQQAFGAAVCAGLGLLVGPLAMMATVTGVALIVYARQPVPELEPVEQVADLDLERKAVASLLAADDTPQLAQAYALFVQRHPTLALEPDAQAALSRELLASGHRALGLAALDKALAQSELRDRKLLEERRNVYAADPAYAFEGLAGPLGTERIDARLPLMRRLLERPPADGRWWLAALSPRGWGMEYHPPVRLPGEDPALPPFRGALLAGPFGPAELAAAAAARWDAGQPVLVVSALALELPAVVIPVHEMHLSQKAAVFQTAQGERACAWDEIEAVVLVWLDEVKVEHDVRVSAQYEGQRRTIVSEKVEVERVQWRPILEIHAAGERLRVDGHHPALFDYLGRRREASYATNVGIAARDLSRFAPKARVSHGLTALLTGRTLPAQHFPDLRRIEEYIRWLHATGSAEARASWAPVWSALVEEE